MTRPYAHQPEPDWAARRYRQATSLLRISQETVARPQGADAGIYNAGVDAAWEAAAWGWFLEEPLDAVRGHLAAAGELVRRVLTVPEGADPELHSAERWVASALLAGDPATAAEVGRRTVRAPDQPVAVLPVVLALLARGDDGAAAAESQRLAAVVADPTTPPASAHALAHLDVLAASVAARDPAGFEGAARARDAAVAARHRRAPARRAWAGVLDRPAAALVSLGALRGLVPPTGVATVPVELVPAGR